MEVGKDRILSAAARARGHGSTGVLDILEPSFIDVRRIDGGSLSTPQRHWKARMKLIGSLTSPYVRKVRIVMAEKRIEFELVAEDPWDAATKVPDYNPLGKVPTLVMEDGGAVFDSRVIVEYLDTISPVNKLIPSPGRSRVEVRCWEALADGICDAAILARLEAARPADRHARRIGKAPTGSGARWKRSIWA
jgi:glutathione S-transferase